MEPIGLTPEMMAALRRLILGHTGTDATQLAADHAEAAIEAEYVNSTGLLTEMVRSWIESDEFAATWRTNPTFSRVSEGALTEAMLRDVRNLILGRLPDDESSIASSADAAAEELAYITRTEDLGGTVRSWIESDEFFEMWSRNETFRRVQGLDAFRSRAVSRRPLLHVHIPKTAGTSINAALLCHFQRDEAYAKFSPVDLVGLPLARILSANFIAGHLGFTIVDLMRFRNPFVFTMARDPQEQLPSAWRYLRRERKIPDDLRFEDWTTHEEFGPRTNMQTRAFVRSLQSHGIEQSDRWIWDFPNSESDEFLSSSLERRIGEVDLAAPSERVAELYRRVVRDCELPGDPTAEFPHLNTTDRTPISDEGRELIDSITQLDRRFYELCIERWEADS